VQDRTQSERHPVNLHTRDAQQTPRLTALVGEHNQHPQLLNMKIQKLTLDNEDIKKAVQAHLATIGITLPVHSVLHENKWNDHEVVFDFQVKNNLIQDDKSQ
jgi:hypothetical protein